MKNLFRAFTESESGAITVEFLVLVAAVGGLGIVGLVSLPSGHEEVNADPNRAIKSFVDGFEK